MYSAVLSLSIEGIPTHGFGEILGLEVVRNEPLNDNLNFHRREKNRQASSLDEIAVTLFGTQKLVASESVLCTLDKSQQGRLHFVLAKLPLSVT